MKKLHERLITAAGIAILVGIFCYQVAYGTNESAYRFGYHYGKDQWQCWKESEINGQSCFMGNTTCTSTITNAAKVVTNQTACIHGFVNGWNKVCTHNIYEGGALQYEGGLTPSKVICPDTNVNEGLPDRY
jgi:hypothetical protein